MWSTPNVSSDFRLLYLHDYLLGPDDAGSSRAWETLQLLRQAGIDARALSSGYNPLTRLPVRDPTFQGGPPVETYHALPPCNGRLTRGAALLANAGLLLPRLLRSARYCDLIYFSSPPLTGALAVWATQLRHGIPYVVEVRDLWPAAGSPLGIFSRGSLTESAFAGLEKLILSRARGVISLTRGITEHLRQHYPGLPLATIPNGVLRERIDAAVPRPRFSRRPLRMAYFGNLTAASDPLFAARLAGRLVERVELHVAGAGRMEQDFIREARQCGAALTLHGPIAHRDLPGFLATMDVSLVPVLPDPFFRCVISNKLLESMAATLPVLCIGEGESADLVRASAGGIVVPRGPDEMEMAVEAFRRLEADPASATAMGQAGQRFVRANFCRQDLTSRLLSRLREWR